MDNIIGEKFGMLAVIGYDGYYVSPSGGTHQKLKCLCDCGKECSALKEHVLSGRKQSCGCLRHKSKNKTHGDIKSRLYKIWGNMRNRCSNPNNPAWKNYGERGIRVCKEWDSYESFRDWATENGYDDSLSLDRIDNNLGYSPDNCRWADRVEQANNKRTNVIIEYADKTMTMAQWSKLLGIPYNILHERLNRNKWTVERAFTQPIRGTV